MKKGILKKSGLGSSSGRRARWNEDNLEANDVIKTHLNPSKIDEPKTPYHPPLDVDVAPIIYADIEPLDLDDVETAVIPSDLHDGSSAVVPERNSKGDFSKQRLKHYDMKAAFVLGKQLCDEAETPCEDLEYSRAGQNADSQGDWAPDANPSGISP